jgi:hypothetical protein
MSLDIEYITEATDDLDIRDRHNEIMKLLWNHDCEVTFKKINGDVRVMPCTLRQEAIPQREAITLHETRLYKPETLSVWCLDKSEWRAFKVGKVMHVRVLNGTAS